MRQELLVAALIVPLAGCATAAQPTSDNDSAVRAVIAAAEPVRGDPHDYDALLTLIGDNSFVLLGESTRGTREFYYDYAITRRSSGASPATPATLRRNSGWSYSRYLHCPF